MAEPIHQRLSARLEAVLAPLGFGLAGGDRLVRLATEIPQAAAVSPSRFGAALPGGAAWIELHFGHPAVTGPSPAADFPPLLILRQDQVVAGAPPYYADGPVAVDDATLQGHVRQFAELFEQCATGNGLLAAIDDLPNGADAFHTIRGQILAALGRPDEARAAFLASGDDPAALRRIAAGYGISLDPGGSSP